MQNIQINAAHYKIVGAVSPVHSGEKQSGEKCTLEKSAQWGKAKRKNVHSGEKQGGGEGTLGTSRGAIWTPNMPWIAPGVFHLKSFEYLHRQLPKVAEMCVLF